jgi:hypothetical protein
MSRKKNPLMPYCKAAKHYVDLEKMVTLSFVDEFVQRVFSRSKSLVSAVVEHDERGGDVFRLTKDGLETNDFQESLEWMLINDLLFEGFFHKLTTQKDSMLTQIAKIANCKVEQLSEETTLEWRGVIPCWSFFFLEGSLDIRDQEHQELIRLTLVGNGNEVGLMMFDLLMSRELR